jgi:hypothetical protein
MRNGRTKGNVAIRGWHERAGRNRRGRHQIAVKRALTAYAATLTTRELFEFVYPGCANRSEWRWFMIRRAANRYGQRLEPRTRPLRWRLRPGVLDGK